MNICKICQKDCTNNHITTHEECLQNQLEILTHKLHLAKTCLDTICNKTITYQDDDGNYNDCGNFICCGNPEYEQHDKDCPYQKLKDVLKQKE